MVGLRNHVELAAQTPLCTAKSVNDAFVVKVENQKSIVFSYSTALYKTT